MVCHTYDAQTVIGNRKHKFYTKNGFLYIGKLNWPPISNLVWNSIADMHVFYVTRGPLNVLRPIANPFPYIQNIVIYNYMN